jgi:hypothetical protein
VKRIIPKIGRIRDAETGELVQGVLIRDPKTLQRLPAGGIVVDRVDAHWRRQALMGGVKIVDVPALAPLAASTAPRPPPRRRARRPRFWGSTPRPRRPSPASESCCNKPRWSSTRPPPRSSPPPAKRRSSAPCP